MVYAHISLLINALEVVDALIDMKFRIVQEFNALLERAKRGHYDDYESILEKISFIELGGKLPNPTKVYHNLMA